jgi:hypothetical protein
MISRPQTGERHGETCFALLIRQFYQSIWQPARLPQSVRTELAFMLAVKLQKSVVFVERVGGVLVRAKWFTRARSEPSQLHNLIMAV